MANYLTGSQSLSYICQSKYSFLFSFAFFSLRCKFEVKHKEKIMKAFLKTTLASAILTSFSAPLVLASDVVIGVPNWPSVRVTAHVLKVVMEENFGLEGS